MCLKVDLWWRYSGMIWYLDWGVMFDLIVRFFVCGDRGCVYMDRDVSCFFECGR